MAQLRRAVAITATALMIVLYALIVVAVANWTLVILEVAGHHPMVRRAVQVFLAAAMSAGSS